MPLDPMPEWVFTQQRAIGERMRRTRRAAGLSQAQLGERIGRDHKTVHRWENMITPPQLVDLLLVAHALHMPLSDLVREE